MELSHVLIEPVVTEKAYELQSKGIHVFRINKDASKTDVKRAINLYYGIEPEKVNITMMKPKVRLAGRGKEIQKRQAVKKATVKLPKGKTLDLTKLTKLK